jgi:hypothetical protein
MDRPPHLPLLENFFDLVKDRRGCFSDWACVYVQHILSSNISCADFLVRMGLSKKNLRIVGKAYSTSELALQFYGESGYSACSVGTGYAYSEPFDAGIIRRIASDLVQLAKRANRLLVIDEGGLAIQALTTLPPDLFSDVAITELTARGATHYPLLSPFYPIVDVARSFAKKTVEAPIIARSMVGRLTGELQRETSIDLQHATVGVVGAGAIGRAVIGQMKDRAANVLWYDRHEERAGATVSAILSGANVILSCTGDGLDWADLLSDASRSIVLVNCGSSDVEFKLWSVRALFKHFRVQNVEEPWRASIVIEVPKSKQFTFLSGGFPINFDGSEDPIPPSEIQLTRSLLMAGAVQAVMTGRAGVHELNASWQEVMMSEFAGLQTSAT